MTSKLLKENREITFPQYSILDEEKWAEQYISQLHGWYNICGFIIAVSHYISRKKPIAVFFNHELYCVFELKKKDLDIYLKFIDQRREFESHEIKLDGKLSIKMIYDIAMKYL